MRAERERECERSSRMADGGHTSNFPPSHIERPTASKNTCYTRRVRTIDFGRAHLELCVMSV